MNDDEMMRKCQEIDKGTLILMPGYTCMAIGPMIIVSRHIGPARDAWYCQVAVWNLTRQTSEYLCSATAGTPQNAQRDWCHHWLVARKATIHPVDSSEPNEYSELDEYEDSDNM